ncbi:MAG TPA: DUF896 domain-containing protein [Clostridiales bacterium]|nr:DUF896 domain-containing protein [Clostridiales bacterium]
MEQAKIDRISELARKSRTEEGLTAEERQEQALLRSEYMSAIRSNLEAQLNNTYLVDEDGNKTRVRKKHST